MCSQVTTKRGDQGETAALSGDTCLKSHPIMETAGSVDEFRAQLALLRLLLLDSGRSDKDALSGFITYLLHSCFLMGSQCSDPLLRKPEFHKGAIGPSHIERLEQAQAELETRTVLPHAFIVGASNIAAAHADMACTLARRLERRIVQLKVEIPDFEAGHLLIYVNRLSDYLYILARYLEEGKHEVVDYSLLK